MGLVCIIKCMSIKVKIEFITVQFNVIGNESFVRQTGFFCRNNNVKTLF